MMLTPKVKETKRGSAHTKPGQPSSSTSSDPAPKR
jgi:hypothetical protein